MHNSSASTAAALPTQVVWDESMAAFSFGPYHPMHPSRLQLTARLATELGLFAVANVQVVPSEPATAEQLTAVHSAEYVAAVRRLSDDPNGCDPRTSDRRWGVGTEDTPAVAGMFESSARLAGGSLAGAEALLDGSAVHVVNFAGGMHHAARARASGFCIFNDVALAIAALLDGGTRRVLYIDIDAHHGDGTESIFWNDPRVMTVSLHETGLQLFPGTGFANDLGGPDALGSAVNVALPSRTTDAGWLRAFYAVVPQLAGAFEPEVIVSQHGCDSHALDPLSHLAISVDAQREAAIGIAALASRHCAGRWLATGGGGYSVTDVVPRAWSHLIGIAAGAPVAPETAVPGPWREYVEETYGITAPESMGDGANIWWRSWEAGYDPHNDVDRAVMATRKEIFPLHGLDPWFD